MKKSDQRADQKGGQIFPFLAAICVLLLPVIVLPGLSYPIEETAAEETRIQNLDFDYKGKALFKSFDRMQQDYPEGASAGRTLGNYYSRRQYPGAPPEIPHPVKMHRKRLECLSCHAGGGWTKTLQKMTPVTPHPDQIGCLQCHVRPIAGDLFRETDWKSIPPPSLGGSYLPGAPPPIPHDLQMRENCLPCHASPSAVRAIRAKHPLRSNCRQCHVSDAGAGLFQREAQRK